MRVKPKPDGRSGLPKANQPIIPVPLIKGNNRFIAPQVPAISCLPNSTGLFRLSPRQLAKTKPCSYGHKLHAYQWLWRYRGQKQSPPCAGAGHYRPIGRTKKRLLQGPWLGFVKIFLKCDRILAWSAATRTNEGGLSHHEGALCQGPPCLAVQGQHIVPIKSCPSPAEGELCPGALTWLWVCTRKMLKPSVFSALNSPDLFDQKTLSRVQDIWQHSRGRSGRRSRR